MKIKKFIFRRVESLLLQFVRIIPVNSLRCFIYTLAGIEIGNGTFIACDAIIKRGVTLGKNVEIRSNCYLQYVKIGNNTIIDKGSLLIGVKNKNFSIGSECYIGYYNILDGSGGLEIGDYVHIASPSVGIWTHSSIKQALLGSNIGDHTHRQEGTVKIDNNVWIGGNVTIYPNTEISKYCIILPNSVVNKNVAQCSMVGGVPIKFIKRIKIEEDNLRLVDY